MVRPKRMSGGGLRRGVENKSIRLATSDSIHGNGEEREVVDGLQKIRGQNLLGKSPARHARGRIDYSSKTTSQKGGRSRKRH